MVTAKGQLTAVGFGLADDYVVKPLVCMDDLACCRLKRRSPPGNCFVRITEG